MNSETNTQLNRFGMVSCSHCIGCSEMEEEYYQCSTEEDIAAEEGKTADKADKAGAGEGTAGAVAGTAGVEEDKKAEEGIEGFWVEEGTAGIEGGMMAGEGTAAPLVEAGIEAEEGKRV